MDQRRPDAISVGRLDGRRPGRGRIGAGLLRASGRCGRNVGVASDKGTNYAAPPAGNVAGSVTISLPPPPASGYYAGPVTATLTDADGGTAPISYTLDGVTTSDVASGTTVTVSGDGDHVLSASVAGGAVSTVSIPIDAGPPQIVSSLSAGATYLLRQNVPASFGCTDGFSVTSCSGLVDGSISVLPDQAPADVGGGPPHAGHHGRQTPPGCNRR